MVLHHGSFLIRKSTDRSLFAAPRGLSQLVTSFFGSWCQGIHLMLLFAWTSFKNFRSLACSQFYLNCLSFLKHGYLSQQKGFDTFLHFFRLTTKLSKCSTLVELCEFGSRRIQFTLWLERPDLLHSIPWVPDSSLSSLSVFRTQFFRFIRFSMNIGSSAFADWLAQVDSNHRPRAYQARALTSWAMRQ